tara:strand:- start:105 stop:380 length:276 start_codon:yes stop_codon:yes gene_type:complete
MIISTTNINDKYEVIDTVFVLQSEGAGGFLGTGGIDTDAAFDGVKSLLSAKAQELGADAIIGCDFEQRIANDALGKQVLEIFAFGTAVKII